MEDDENDGSSQRKGGKAERKKGLKDHRGGEAALEDAEAEEVEYHDIGLRGLFKPGLESRQVELNCFCCCCWCVVVVVASLGVAAQRFFPPPVILPPPLSRIGSSRARATADPSTAPPQVKAAAKAAREGGGWFSCVTHVVHARSKAELK